MNAQTRPEPGTEAAALLKPPQAARRLSICERKLWGLTAPRGPVPCVRIGRGVFYSPADLDHFVRRSTETAKAA